MAELTKIDIPLQTKGILPIERLAGEGNLLRRDGSKSLTGNLSAGNHKITNLQNGTDLKDAVNVEQLQGVKTDLINIIVGSAVPPISLQVISNNQVTWNIGGSETRTVLFINGVRQTLGSDYVINLPVLTWTSTAFSISIGDELLLM